MGIVLRNVHRNELLCVLVKIFSCSNAKKKTERLKGFNFSHVYWWFSNDVMAVKGLRNCLSDVTADFCTWQTLPPAQT